MLRFLGVLVVLVALVAGIGYYQGWWSFSTTDTKGNLHIDVNVDKEKIEKDKKKLMKE
jgi:hypothetical protein